MKKIKSIDSYDELFKEFPGMQIDFFVNTDPALNNGRKNDYKLLLQRIVEKGKEKFTSFAYAINDRNDHHISLHLSRFEVGSDHNLRNWTIYAQDQEIITCDQCSFRLVCLLNEDYPCITNEKECEKLKKIWREKYAFEYKVEEWHVILDDAGFQPKTFGVNSQGETVGFINIWKKDDMTIYL